MAIHRIVGLAIVILFSVNFLLGFKANANIGSTICASNRLASLCHIATHPQPSRALQRREHLTRRKKAIDCQCGGSCWKVHATTMDSVPYSASTGRVMIFNLDGVLLNCEQEAIIAAYMTAEKLWPEIISEATGISAQDGGARRLWMNVDEVSEDAIKSYSKMPLWLYAKMRQIRPTMRSVVDAVTLIRLLVEEALTGIRRSNVKYRPLTAGEINANFDADQLKVLRMRYKADSLKIENAYYEILDDWKWRDIKDFCSNVRPYNVVSDAFRDALQRSKDLSSNVYIVSSMRTIDILPMMRHSELPIDVGHIRGHDPEDFLAGDTIDEISNIVENYTGSEIVYVDGNAETMINMAQDPRFEQLKFRLATWGVSTPTDRSRALALPNVEIVEPHQMPALLRGDVLPIRGKDSIIEEVDAKLLGLDEDDETE